MRCSMISVSRFTLCVRGNRLCNLCKAFVYISVSAVISTNADTAVLLKRYYCLLLNLVQVGRFLVRMFKYYWRHLLRFIAYITGKENRYSTLFLLLVDKCISYVYIVYALCDCKRQRYLSIFGKRYRQ